jgi:prepilin-type N-terminal cleavage/methylation domain-containing protein
MKRRRPGFTLIEMIIASALVALLIAAILALQSLVLRGQVKEWRARKIAGESVYALEAIKTAMRAASVIAEPPADDAQYDKLIAYVNVSPADMASRVDQSAPQTYFVFCYQASQGELYKYTGAYARGMSLAGMSCGADPGTGAARETLISGLQKAAVSYRFSRSAGNTNAVNIDYSISYQGTGVTGNTSVNVEKSL